MRLYLNYAEIKEPERALRVVFQPALLCYSTPSTPQCPLCTISLQVAAQKSVPLRAGFGLHITVICWSGPCSFNSHQDEDKLFLDWGTALVLRVARKADKYVPKHGLFVRRRQPGPTPTIRPAIWTSIHKASEAHDMCLLKTKLKPAFKFRGRFDPGFSSGTWREKGEPMLTSLKISSL